MVTSKAGPTTHDHDVLAMHKDKVLAIKAGLASVGARVMGLVQRGGIVWPDVSTVLHWMRTHPVTAALLGSREAVHSDGVGRWRGQARAYVWT